MICCFHLLFHFLCCLLALRYVTLVITLRYYVTLLPYEKIYFVLKYRRYVSPPPDMLEITSSEIYTSALQVAVSVLHKVHPVSIQVHQPRTK